MLSTPSTDYLHIGFERIQLDLQVVIEAFADVLKSLNLEELADLLPWIGKNPASSNPEELPSRLGLAYSVAFQLLNMVEENTSALVRDLREEEEEFGSERGLWGNQISRLKKRGISEETIANFLPQICVESVLTAHPTEAKRLSVLDHHRAIFNLLSQRAAGLGGKKMSQRRRRELQAVLERVWRTGEILLEKPTLTDERRNVLYYFREVFPAVLPALDDRLKLAWVEAGFDLKRLKKPGALPKLRFGTWVGGDRDGHPGVTAEVTKETLERLHTNGLVVQHRALTQLASKLTLTTWMQTAPRRLEVLKDRLHACVGDEVAHALYTHREEPWRQVVDLMIARLPLKITPGQLAMMRKGPMYYSSAKELIEDLSILRESLVEAGALRLAEADVDPVLRSLEVFGFHLAALDIRQNSVFHATALSQLMKAAGFTDCDIESWTEEKRLEFLSKELQSPRPFLHAQASAGAEADAVLQCYRVLSQHHELYGADGVGSLIVSMTRRVSDLLIVYLLAREAGLLRSTPTGTVCLLPVVPLFETADDLQEGPGMLAEFLNESLTQRSLAYQAETRGRAGRLIQQVMVGYSDSNKDAGIIASQWALHLAQSRLVTAAAEKGVEVCFFHGRGGTVSRGAGPTHRFLDALPHRSVTGEMRLTEQGETIAQKFGNAPTAAYNLELLLAGVTATTAKHSRPQRSDHPLSAIAEKLAKNSRVAYRELLECDGFMSFYRQATPIDVLEQSRIGSRPSRRTGQASLDDLRAIPWVFSWNQSRFYVPGWYGAGSGLASLTDEEIQALSTELKDWPFMNYVITNVESSLASADLELMKCYADLVTDDDVRDRVFGKIVEEFERTKQMLVKLRGGSLQELRPRMWKTLALRAEALKVLHHQQVSLLRKWRQLEEAQAAQMLPDLLLSVNAIASGLRTTG